MDSRSSFIRRNIGQIQNKVADLPEEYIGRRPALVPVILIHIAIDYTQTFKRGSWLDNRTCIRVANELSKVVVDNGPRYNIGAFREINNCRSGGRGPTAFWRGTVAIADGSIDRFGIIALAITYFSQLCFIIT